MLSDSQNWSWSGRQVENLKQTKLIRSLFKTVEVELQRQHMGALWGSEIVGYKTVQWEIGKMSAVSRCSRWIAIQILRWFDGYGTNTQRGS